MDGRKKHLLIVMVGTSPAVITETVYALCQEKKNLRIRLLFIQLRPGRKRLSKSCSVQPEAFGVKCLIR